MTLSVSVLVHFIPEHDLDRERQDAVVGMVRWTPIAIIVHQEPIEAGLHLLLLFLWLLLRAMRL